MVNETAVGVEYETRNMLDELKIHPRETYNDLIKRLIGELRELKNG